MDTQVYDNQQEFIYNSSVQTQDVGWKTCCKQWMIETIGERGSGKSMLAAQHNDDDDWKLYQNRKIMFIKKNWNKKFHIFKKYIG